MRALALGLFVVPYGAAASSVCSASQPVFSQPAMTRVSLLNMSGQRRQVVLPDRRIALPVGRRVDINVCPTCDVHVVSDMDSRVNQYLQVHPADTALIVVVR